MREGFMMRVTHRDRHILLRALTIAIAAIDAAQGKAEPHGDREEMGRLVQELGPSEDELELYADSAHRIVKRI